MTLRAGPPVLSARPRDAASLVLARGWGKDAEILFGRREPRDRFMPDVHVFPGGRVDDSDAVHAVASELRAEVAERVARSASPSRARALGVAAIRETWEETGLVVGDLDGNSIRPALHRLEYVARAITPAGNPIRYHARFFLADAQHVHGELRSNGELLDLAWVPIADATKLNIMDVTARVLREAIAHLADDGPEGGVPLIHYRRGAMQIKRD